MNLRDEIAQLHAHVLARNEPSYYAEVEPDDGYDGDYLSMDMAEAVVEDLEAEDAYVAEFESGIQNLERRLGRRVLDAERQQVWEALPDVSEPSQDVPEIYGDLHKDEPPLEGGAFAEALLRESEERENPTPESVAPLPKDPTDEQRIEFMNARWAGAEVEGD